MSSMVLVGQNFLLNIVTEARIAANSSTNILTTRKNVQHLVQALVNNDIEHPQGYAIDGVPGPPREGNKSLYGVEKVSFQVENDTWTPAGHTFSIPSIGVMSAAGDVNKSAK